MKTQIRTTPVFGSSCPPHGLSGLIRVGAYKISEARLSHWLLLYFADRLESLPEMKGGALLAAIGLSAALLPVVSRATTFRRAA